jgi:hypothetical protein
MPWIKDQLIVQLNHVFLGSSASLSFLPIFQTRQKGIQLNEPFSRAPKEDRKAVCGLVTRARAIRATPTRFA